MPQRPPYAIHRHEIIGVCFPQTDEYPRVFSTRPDFPDTPHQNIAAKGLPYSLCIDERPWREAKLTHTSADLLYRITNWFNRILTDELHGAEQALDPYLLPGTSFTVIFKEEVFKQQEGEEKDIVCIGIPNTRILIAKNSDQNDKEKASFEDVVFLTFELHPDKMKRIRVSPDTLELLHDEMFQRGVDLIQSIYDKTREWTEEKSKLQNFRFGCHLGILVKMPIIHPLTGHAGASSTIAFVTENTLGEIGVAIDAIVHNPEKDASESQYGATINFEKTVIEKEKLREFTISAADVTSYFNSNLAARLAGSTSHDTRKVTLIGAGAIGSLVAESLAREGRYEWTIIDADILFPHNLARHALSVGDIGHPKATRLSEHLIYEIPATRASGYFADIMSEKSEVKPKIDAALNDSDLIFDASASVPVSRYINDLETEARRASFFYNATGSTSVLMMESSNRSVDINSIESLFYSTIITTPQINDILTVKPDQIQYSGDCRSLTTRLACSRAQLLSNLIAQAIPNATEQDDALLQIWTIRNDGSISTMRITPDPLETLIKDGWTIRMLRQTMENMTKLRNDRLPSETGGVLLGVVDTYKQRIDIVSALPAPQDSQEHPHEFIRGTLGVLETIKAAATQTGGHIRYVGEWHSHPPGVSPHPSFIDLTQLAGLTLTLADDGSPAVQLIISDHGISGTLGTTSPLNLN